MNIPTNGAFGFNRPPLTTTAPPLSGVFLCLYTYPNRHRFALRMDYRAYNMHPAAPPSAVLDPSNRARRSIGPQLVRAYLYVMSPSHTIASNDGPLLGPVVAVVIKLART